MRTIILLLTVALLPEFSRWLMTVGRRDEVIEILVKIRDVLPFDHPELVAELKQLDAIIHSSRQFVSVSQRYSTAIPESFTWEGELLLLLGS